MRNPAVTIGAAIAGASIAWVDTRPTWDDTGVTAFAMVLAAGLCGLAAPTRPWLTALAVGVWIPLHAAWSQPAPGSLAMLVVLAFPLAGACAGRAARRFFHPA